MIQDLRRDLRVLARQERQRRRALKDAYIAEHGGAPSDLGQRIEDACRRARLQGPCPSLGLALALAGAFEVGRARWVDPSVTMRWVIDREHWSDRALRSVPARVSPLPLWAEGLTP